MERLWSTTRALNSLLIFVAALGIVLGIALKAARPWPFIIAVFAVLVAWIQTYLVARSLGFSAIEWFFKQLEDKENREARGWVQRSVKLFEITHGTEDFSDLSEPERDRAVRTINMWNRIGQMVEYGVLPATVVFGVSHLQIMRVYFQLQRFRQWEEQQLGGGRWGRRLIRLDQAARIFNDANKIHRKRGAVSLTLEDNREVIIHQPPTPPPGLWTRVWWGMFFRRLLGFYLAWREQEGSAAMRPILDHRAPPT